MKWGIVFLFLVLLFLQAFSDDFIIDDPNNTTASSSSSSSTVSTYSPQKSPYTPSGKNLTSIGSVPTPNGLERGAIYGEFTMYDNGGVNARFLVGIMDAISIGISENLDSLIGSGDINVNIPGAYVKLTIINDLNNFNWALGFDSFAYGKEGTYFSTNSNVKPATIYGFYSAVGWHYSAFGGKDIFSAGIRWPLLPAEVNNFNNVTLFFGATLNAPQYFTFALTLENLYVNFSHSEQILPSIIFSLYPNPPFKISLILQYDFSISKLNRILSLSYETGF